MTANNIYKAVTIPYGFYYTRGRNRNWISGPSWAESATLLSSTIQKSQHIPMPVLESRTSLTSAMSPHMAKALLIKKVFFINMLNKRFDIQLTVSWTTSIFFCLTSLDSKDSKSFCRIQIRHIFLDSGQGCVDTHSFFADPDADLNLAGCLNIKMNRWSPNPNRNVSDPPEWLFLSLQTSSIPDSSCKNHRFQIEFGREPYKKPL